jgi:hypothetical protein
LLTQIMTLKTSQISMATNGTRLSRSTIDDTRGT